MNILTFDIEEWYIYELYPKGGRGYYVPIINDYLDKILDLLDEIDSKATFYCLGSVARTDPKVITKIANRGHEIGCHSNNHLLIHQMTSSDFKKDTHQAIDTLEQIIGQKIEYYRAPAFSITENTQWALEILIEEGITCDSSIFPATRRFGGFPTFKAMKPSVIEINGKSLMEFPINFVTVLNLKLMFSGGGYFRLFPYWLVKYLMKQSDYNIAYFHIRDFDSQQKHIKHPKYLMSYYGINSAFDNFKKLIIYFDFISVGSAIEQINWKEAPNVLLK